MFRKMLLVCSLLTLAISACGRPPQGDIYDEAKQEFIAGCQAGTAPFLWNYPPPHQTPTYANSGVPSSFGCFWYRDDLTGPPIPPHHWDTTQLPWSVEPCANPPPSGKITFNQGNSVGGSTSQQCVMLTVPTDGTKGIIDFQWLAALGWRSSNGIADNFFKSFYLGAHTTLMVSDRARVDLSADWICQVDSHCHQFETATGLIANNYFTDGQGGSTLKPWSFWYSVGP